MNWIDDRPAGLRLQNLALATMTGPMMNSLPKNLTADVQHVFLKMRIFGPKATIHPSRESICDCSRIFPTHGNPSTSFLPNMHFQCCMLLQGTFGGDFDIFAASGGSAAWVLLQKNPFKTNWREGLSCGPIQLFQHRI